MDIWYWSVYINQTLERPALVEGSHVIPDSWQVLVHCLWFYTYDLTLVTTFSSPMSSILSPQSKSASPWKLKPVRVISKSRSDSSTNAAATERLCPPEDGTGRASGMLGPAYLPTFTALWPDDVGWVWLPQAHLMWVRWIRLAALWLNCS